MMSDIDPYILEIIDTVSSELGDALDRSSTRWISRPDGKDKISDASLALYVDGQGGGEDVVVLVSNPDFPHVVQEDLEKAKDVARLVRPDVARHIIKPLAFGVHGTQSYAALKRLSALSENRAVRYVQKRRASPGIVDWLADLGTQTRQIRTTSDEIAAYFIAPLQAITADQDISPALRTFSQQCLSEVLDAKRELFTCVEHGDFWLGNVFFEPGPKYDAFSIIDWRGSRADGYPCLDLARYCLSTFKTGSKPVAQLFQAYRSKLGLSPYEIGFYSIVALGRLGMNLDKFPKKRYCALADRIFFLLNAQGFTAGRG